MGRIVVLGCGPAGLAAAHAAVSLGHETVIISNADRQSQLMGCQYLHAPVPGYETVSRVRVSYQLAGTAEQYRRKVYGDTWQGTVSPEDFVGDHDAWDIRETYQRLWKDLIGSLQVGLICKYVKQGMIPFAGSLHPDLVVSTIPAQALCQGQHEFKSYTIWANGDTTIGNYEVDNLVVCDGTAEHEWYRISNVFGYRTTEWSHQPHRLMKAVPVIKPLWTDCDCHPEILRAGRYGAWEKKRLVHEVFPAVKEALK